jgi:Carboxypeptidase regulatory-like domain
MRTALLILLASLLALVAGAQERNGSIIGTVSDSVSHQPLRKVMVSLALGNGPPVPDAATDDAGAFAFHNLQPGQYQLGVGRSDYPSGKTIIVSPSENPDPIRIELIPGAIVSGRILDEDGDPLNGCVAQARRAGHPEQVMASGDAEPGGYRLFGLQAGKYILAVQCMDPVFQPRPFSAGPDPPPSLAYPLQFYPAALDAGSAQPIELAAGTERAGADFRIRPAHVTQVRAVIAPSSAGWHGRDLFGGLVRPGDLSGNEFRLMSPDSSGSFRFPQVFPGSYVLLITTLDQENRIGGIQRIEVKHQPLNTVIELKHAVDIHGTVELESGANSANVQLPLISIQLRPEYPADGGPISVADAAVKQDGSFTLNSVIPVEWRLYISGAPVFVKSVWLGTKVSSGPTLDLSSGSPDTLKIVLSANTASIRGTAPPGTTVAYRDLDNKLGFRLSVQVEQDGHFRIERRAPGRYRLAAGESFDAIPEDGGREITVQEGETVSVDLPAN